MNNLIIILAMALLAGCGGGGGTNTSPLAPQPGTPSGNISPVANAGVNRSVETGTVVTLDGSLSSDADNDPLTYRWLFSSIPSGSSAAISPNTSVKPTFVPDVSGEYTVNLVVNDGKIDSAVAVVRVIAASSNSAPIANAGASQSVRKGASVFLDGSRSSDVNGDQVLFDWKFLSRPTGSVAQLSLSSSVRPTFIADVEGLYTISLVVSDGKLSSAPSIVTVTVTSNNTPPTAVAGADQSVTTGKLVTLDGSGSRDVDGDVLSYRWSLLVRPSLSNAFLTGSSGTRPTFVADKDGSYRVQLIVNDGKVDSASDSVTIEAVPPVPTGGSFQLSITASVGTVNNGASPSLATIQTVNVPGASFSSNAGVANGTKRVFTVPVTNCALAPYTVQVFYNGTAAGNGSLNASTVAGCNSVVSCVSTANLSRSTVSGTIINSRSATFSCSP